MCLYEVIIVNFLFINLKYTTSSITTQTDIDDLIGMNIYNQNINQHISEMMIIDVRICYP